MLDRLPDEVQRTLTEFRACELATLARDGTPIAWPVTVLFQPEKGRLLATTSIGMPQKAYNARRTPRVSLLYSDPTASGLEKPVPVLVQGDATVSQEIETWNEVLEELWQLLAVRQPPTVKLGSDPITRWLMDWYFMRLLMSIQPRKITWWPEGSFASDPMSMELQYAQE